MLRNFLVFFLLFSSLNLSAQHVFYGERTADSTKLALFFDRYGFPYPDHLITDSSMITADGSLYTWFMQNGEAFIGISAAYELFPERIDHETIARLRDSIIAGRIREINARSAQFPAVAFYVHGFRKQYVSKSSDVTSVEEFRLVKANLATYGKPQALEVEVYWDGMYDCCFSANRKKNKQLFELYETAASNAKHVGLSLRAVLSGTQTDHLQLVSHSLGARVATVALFNCIPVARNIHPTPSQQRVSICLLAPAIDGHTTFQHWHKRQSTLDVTAKDNYRLLIVYNEDDFVLRKKDPKTGLFGPGAKRYGETSLGCNYKQEAVELERYFNEHYPHSTIRLIDKTSLGKAHSFRYYASGEQLREVSDFLWEY